MAEQSLRFGVRSENSGIGAATWKVWTPSNKEDVYLAARELKGAIKLSLHESSNWHFAYSKDFFESRVPTDAQGENGRFIHNWNRPQPLAPGITLAARIVTPWTALKFEEIESSGIAQIEPPHKGFASEVGIFLIEPPAIVTSWPGKSSMGTLPVGYYEFGNERLVWVVSWQIPCPDFSELRGKFSYFNGSSEEDIGHSLRALVFGDHEDGSKVFYDLVANRVKNA